MSIIRTEQQADAVEILKLVMETHDYYADMSEVANDDIGAVLECVAAERASFIPRAKAMVKALGELPVQPDPDKELLQKVGGGITQLLAGDSNDAVIDKCLQHDQKLADLLANTELRGDAHEHQPLIEQLSQHLHATRSKLSGLKDRG